MTHVLMEARTNKQNENYGGYGKGAKLTATGHPLGEERHSPGQQIQAASLISKDPPTRLLG